MPYQVEHISRTLGVSDCRSYRSCICQVYMIGTSRQAGVLRLSFSKPQVRVSTEPAMGSRSSSECALDVPLSSVFRFHNVSAGREPKTLGTDFWNLFEPGLSASESRLAGLELRAMRSSSAWTMPKGEPQEAVRQKRCLGSQSMLWVA